MFKNAIKLVMYINTKQLYIHNVSINCKKTIHKLKKKFVLQDIGRQKLLLPGGRESSVVHFLDSDTIAHLQGVADRANF